MTAELKPCPGCGSEATRIMRMARCCFVACDCGWSGPARTSEKAAIAAWNRRAGEEKRDVYEIALVKVAEWIKEEKAKHTKRKGGQTCGDMSPRVLLSALIELEWLIRIEDARFTFEAMFETQARMVQLKEALDRLAEEVRGYERVPDEVHLIAMVLEAEKARAALELEPPKESK
jgi:Lar family restriction alleviation protein